MLKRISLRKLFWDSKQKEYASEYKKFRQNLRKKFGKQKTRQLIPKVIK